MALTLHPMPFSRNYTNSDASRVALIVTNLVGDLKAEWYSNSATEAMDKAFNLASWPDTIVYLYHTDMNGERSGPPFARIQRDGVGDVKYYIL